MHLHFDIPVSNQAQIVSILFNFSVMDLCILQGRLCDRIQPRLNPETEEFMAKSIEMYSQLNVPQLKVSQLNVLIQFMYQAFSVIL